MELWIRSQDRESLIKGGKHNIGTYYDNLKILGAYSTKERALEVLDKIQNLLQPQIF